MTLAIARTRAQLGIDAPPVSVEVHLSNGLPGFAIVGLPETAVKEAKDRVRSAILNSHLEFPARRITVNLAPADLPKEGGRFDLPIAIGILAASGQLPAQGLDRHELLGELALSGELRPVRAALPTALATGRCGRTLIISQDNAAEAALSGQPVLGAANLLQVCAHLHGREPLPEATPAVIGEPPPAPDLAEVRGQQQAKRALEVAASGGHNLLFYGPPGTGKTMLASRMPGILPPLETAERLAVASVYSVSGHRSDTVWHHRPFRAPHHTASAAALVGGGTQPQPGEISLAHGGVLFLDELPEFQRQVLEVLREPLESGEIRISRARAQTCYPASFQLLAAMNPCPCGYHGSHEGRCRCTPEQISRYTRKISGPLLDRIDLHVPVNAMSPAQLRRAERGETSNRVRQRVIRTRALQLSRQGKHNHLLTPADIEQVCQLQSGDQQFLETAVEKLGLSTRAYHRVLKVARTLADMEGNPVIGREHLAEALHYRSLGNL